MLLQLNWSSLQTILRNAETGSSSHPGGRHPGCLKFEQLDSNFWSQGWVKAVLKGHHWEVVQQQVWWAWVSVTNNIYRTSHRGVGKNFPFAVNKNYTFFLRWLAVHLSTSQSFKRQPELDSSSLTQNSACGF